MPPKKDATGGESNELLAGFTDKETKLLAAAFLSSTAPDKFDYDIMATLTKNTAGSLKKMWPPVKKKAIENYPSFAKFLGQAGADAAASAGEPKPAAAPKSKKRKTVEEGTEDSAEAANESSEPASAANKFDFKEQQKKPVAEKKAPVANGRGRPRKQAKKEEEAIKSEENSADGGDGLGDDLEDDAT